MFLQLRNLFTQESFFNQGICLLRNPSTQEYFFNKRICLLRNLSSAFTQESSFNQGICICRNPSSTKESVYTGIFSSIPVKLCTKVCNSLSVYCELKIGELCKMYIKKCKNNKTYMYLPNCTLTEPLYR